MSVSGIIKIKSQPRNMSANAKGIELLELGRGGKGERPILFVEAPQLGKTEPLECN